MEAGIEVYSDSTLIIDGSYKNLSLIRKVKLTDLPKSRVKSREEPWKIDSRFVDIDRYSLGTLKDNEVFVGIGGKISDILQKIAITHPAGSSTKSVSVDILPNGSPENLYLYVFGENLSKESSSNGLQVFNEQGECVFDSGRKYLRVVGEEVHYPSFIRKNSIRSDREYCLITNPARAERGINNYLDFQIFFSEDEQFIFSGFHLPEGVLISEAILTRGYWLILADVTGY